MSSDIASRVERKLDVRTKKKLDGAGQFWLVFRYFALTILFVIAALPRCSIFNYFGDNRCDQWIRLR